MAQTRFRDYPLDSAYPHLRRWPVTAELPSSHPMYEKLKERRPTLMEVPDHFVKKITHQDCVRIMLLQQKCHVLYATSTSRSRQTIIASDIKALTAALNIMCYCETTLKEVKTKEGP